jgi:4-hydroxybenzoate polyprenyltransferase
MGYPTAGIQRLEHGGLRAYLELLRPPNVVTAVADVLAGYAVAGRANIRALPWLLGATACLYAGGVVLNDFFDRGIDAVERPERPIPSGRVAAGVAGGLGAALLALGVIAAGKATAEALAIAVAIAAFVLLYDAWGKRQAAIGPVNMGLCRALNLLLGIAAVPAALPGHWPLALLPLVYVAAVTMVSRGEVHGGNTVAAGRALGALTGVLIALAFISAHATSGSLVGLALTLLLGRRVLPAFWRAYTDASPAAIRRAVRTGVLSLVLVDAAISAVYAGPLYSAAVLATALVAGGLARLFSVT